MSPRDAVDVVIAWRDNDYDLPIPNTAWGSQLAEAVDVLTEIVGAIA